MKNKKPQPKMPAPDLRQLAYPEHLQESKVIEDLRATVEQLKVFDSIGKTLTSCLELGEVLRLIITKFSTLVGSDHVGLVLLDSENQEFYYQYPNAMERTKDSYPIGRGLLGECLERGRAVVLSNPQSHGSFVKEIDAFVLSKPTSLLALPILSKGSVLGALVFLTEKSERLLTEESLKRLEPFCDYLAIAVENAQHYQKIQDLTITDDLTQLYNSRYLPVVLEREIARARRYQEALSLVFIDLDNFKTVNDRHGHLAGSGLLTEFGNFLFHQIRTTDIGIRYGGDEFVLVLPKTSKAEAVKVVQRMIEDLRGHVFLKGKGLNIQITASFGIATFPEHADSIDGLIAAADHAMYEVKRSSKDGLYAVGA